jgi:arylsulfatase B/arylsulfatase I/J
MHGPIEAPAHYVGNAHCSQVTALNNRNIYCGMMAALDEGIGNLTHTYEQLSIWQDTLVVLAADNGGHVGASGNNAPLRGEKSTNFEGGVRGVSFIHWPGLAPALQGTVSHDVVAVADWLPTFVAGAAGLELEADSFRYGLDGVDQWAALTNPAAGGGPARGPTKGLVHEIGGDNGIRQESYMEGKYKLVRFHASIYFNTKYICVNYSCPTGWNPLPAPSVQPTAPPDERINSTWLFDVFDDPLGMS